MNEIEYCNVVLQVFINEDTLITAPGTASRAASTIRYLCDIYDAYVLRVSRILGQSSGSSGAIADVIPGGLRLKHGSDRASSQSSVSRTRALSHVTFSVAENWSRTAMTYMDDSIVVHLKA